MCFDSRCFQSILQPALGAALLLLLVLPSLVAAETTACFDTYVATGGTGNVGDGLLRVVPDGEDLVVTLRWASEPDRPEATLRLETPSGMLTGDWAAPRFPGETTEQRLDGALAQVSDFGFQYILRLEDPEAQRAEISFRAMVECPEGEVCRYRLVQGLTAGPIVVSEAFWNALAEAREAGWPDLIRYIRDRFPELAGEIPSFAWQMQVSEPKPGTDCSCRWLNIYSALPQTTVSLEQGDGNFPQHVFGHNYDGANYLVGAETIQGPIDIQGDLTWGQGVLGIQLFCTQFSGERTSNRYPTAWPGLPILELEERGISSCPAPCTPTIEHSGQILGCAEATAAGRFGLWANASAKIQASVGLRSMSAVDATTQANVDVGDGQTLRSADLFREGYSATLEAGGAIADAEADAALMVDAASQTQALRSYAYASAAVKYLLSFEVFSSCPEVPYHHSVLDRLNNSQHEGGVAMERWEDP